MAPKLPPRIETFEPGDNDALRIPDAIIHDDGRPQHQQQQREEAFFRELYQQKDTVKRGGHALRHILEAADRLSKAKPQHRLAALGNNSQIGQSQSTGALAGAISELKLSKKPGKSPYSLVQRIRDGDGGKVSLSKAQKSGDTSPAKSPVTHGSKPVRKKSSKKKNSQDEAGVERTRFISSREKRAAAAHRGYLVAALSDAQVQLEHIESLATLVISAPDMEVEPIKPGLKDEQQPQITKGKRPPSPQERDSASEEQDTLAGDESLRDQQLEFEEGCQEEDLQQQEEPQIRELEEEHEDDDLQQQEPQRQESEQEQEYQEQGQEQHDEEFEDQGYVGSHLDDAQEDQEDAESMHEEGMQTQHNVLEDEQGPTGQEKLENLDQSSLKAHNTGLDLVQESRHELTGYEQENEEGTQLKDQDLYESHNNGTANQLINESQDQSEVEHEPKGGQELEDYSEDLGSKLDLQEQEDRPLAGQIVQTRTCEQDAEFYQDQELGSVQQQEQVQGQEDEDQDEYDDEYEDQDVEHEQDHRDQKVQDGILQINQVEHDDSIASPAQNLLMQAQELLATEASSDSTDDDHRAAHGHDGSSDTGDSNDLSILTPLVPDSVAYDDDSRDDAIIAADSVVATALPLPSSDESSCEAADE
ncbi:hypothetical protein PF001_g2624 [Phytophthora fragariae]|nr:hypothetical protein PF001_g2624 [Phytophthora fragariae]